jgi:hypothetical protein
MEKPERKKRKSPSGGRRKHFVFVDCVSDGVARPWSDNLAITIHINIRIESHSFFENETSSIGK